MKVTFKDGTVIEDVTAQELPFVLSMSNPAAVAKKITEQVLAKAAPGLSWVNVDAMVKAFKDTFG